MGCSRLRGLYRVDVGAQRAPFFEMQTKDFALLAIDTGILHSGPLVRFRFHQSPFSGTERKTPAFGAGVS
jgi:hypothetical protein